MHELHPDRFGEIYIISVHPDFQGRNLGRVMVTQGLDVLRKKGVSTAMLFVDQSNVGARQALRVTRLQGRARRPPAALSPQLVLADESADAERDGGGQGPDQHLTKAPT